MVESPLKRRRTDDTMNTSEITRVEQFWLKDGNIILQAQSSQYRVHKSVLAIHSNIFKDMFDLPQPEQEPLTEGCQVVHLSDSAQDIEHILSLIYKGFAYLKEWLQNSDPLPALPIISAMIRLGRKYEFTQLQAEALSRLQISFPSSLRKWLKLRDSFDSTFLFNVINLAHETSITSILPVAYLEVCYHCSLENILQGIENADGTRVRLNSQSMEQCIIGREKLFYRLPKSIFPWLLNDKRPYSIPPKKCNTRSPCRESTSCVMWLVWVKSMEGSRLDFLKGPESLYDLDDICGECMATTLDEYEKGRQSIWNELPGFFGLPTWSDLKDSEILQVGELVR